MNITKRGGLFVLMLLIISILPFISAGVGISWDKESALVPENTKACLTYKVYNPWPQDTYVSVELSDELQQILSSTEGDVTFIPKETSSANAIPVTFCFKTPKIYERDCWIGDLAICKQTCDEELKTYTGEVEVIETGGDFEGAQGSATRISVSAPLRVKIQCVAHARNFTLIYILVAVVAIILLILGVLRKRKTSKKSKHK
jgi:hypothetical protein